MYIIDSRYGNDGYATWVRILRELAVTNFHYFQLKTEIDIMYLAGKCHISEELLMNIIGDLAKMGEFDPYLWESHRVVWSQKFTDSILDAYKKRGNKPLTREEVIAVFDPESTPKPGKSDLKPESAAIESIPPDDGSQNRLRLRPSLEPSPTEPETSKWVTYTTKILAEYFNVSEQINQRSFMDIGRFAQHFANLGNTDVFDYQFKHYRELKAIDGYKHSWKSFAGDPREKYQDGAWCEKEWKLELSEYRKKQPKTGTAETPAVLSAPRRNRTNA